MVINTPNKEFLNCRKADVFVDQDALSSILPFLQLGIVQLVFCYFPQDIKLFKRFLLYIFIWQLQQRF